MKHFLILLIMLLASVASADWLGSFDLNDYLPIHCTTSQFSSGSRLTTADAQYSIFAEEAGTFNVTEIAGPTGMSENFSGEVGLHVASIQLTTGNSFVAGQSYVVLIEATVDSVTAIASHAFRIRSANQTTGATLTTLSTASALTTHDGKLDTVQTGLTAITGTGGVLIGTDLMDRSTTLDVNTKLVGGITPITIADVNTEVDTGLSDIFLDELLSTADTDVVVDNSIMARLGSLSFVADWSDFENAQDSLQAIRDRGDLAWRTGTSSAADEAVLKDSSTIIVGDLDGGTSANIDAVDGVYWDIGEVNSTTLLEVITQFTITEGSFPAEFLFWGYYSGGGSHDIHIEAYNYVSSGYEILGTIGIDTVVNLHTFSLSPSQVDTVTNVGRVLIRMVHTSGVGITSHFLRIDKVELTAESPAETAAVVADAVWEELLTGASHSDATSAGRRLRELSSAVIVTGTSPGTGNTAIRIELNGDASATDGAYDPAVINIIAGTGSGQSRQIWEYDGANKYAYVNRDWKTTPDATSEYVILSNSGDTHVNEGLAAGGGASTITLNALASSVNNAYIGQTVFLAAGVGADQATLIISYDGTTKIATVDTPWVTQPTSGTIYAVLPLHAHPLTEIADSIWEEPRSGHTTGNTFGGDALDNDTWTDARAAALDELIVGGTLYDNIVAIKARWDALTTNVDGNLEVDMQQINGVDVKSTSGNIHALPGNI